MTFRINILIVKIQRFVTKHKSKFIYIYMVLYAVNQKINLPILQVLELLLEYLLS